MYIYDWIWIAAVVAFYGVPFAVGLCVSSWRRAVLVAIASFAGLYVSIWSALGPLFLPLAVQLVTRYELSGILILSFLYGAVQAALLASLGLATKKIAVWTWRRCAQQPSDAVVRDHARLTS